MPAVTRQIHKLKSAVASFYYFTLFDVVNNWTAIGVKIIWWYSDRNPKCAPILAPRTPKTDGSIYGP